MPWIVPGITRIAMSLLACTGPKALEMPFSSIAGAVAVDRPVGVVVLLKGPAQKLSAGQLSSLV